MQTFGTRRVGVVVALAAAAWLGAGCGGTSTQATSAGPAATTTSTTSPANSGIASGQDTKGDTGSDQGTSSTSGSNSSGSGSTSSGASSSGCMNLTVSDALRQALAQANDVPNGQTRPGSVYYGECNGDQYAVAQFQPLPGDTTDQQVPFQDDGSGQRFFVLGGGGRWLLVADEPYDQTQSCAGFTQVPAALRQIWQDCPES